MIYIVCHASVKEKDLLKHLLVSPENSTVSSRLCPKVCFDQGKIKHLYRQVGTSYPNNDSSMTIPDRLLIFQGLYIFIYLTCSNFAP